jgi:hypothetical protein
MRLSADGNPNASRNASRNSGAVWSEGGWFIIAAPGPISSHSATIIYLFRIGKHSFSQFLFVATTRKTFAFRSSHDAGIGPICSNLQDDSIIRIYDDGDASVRARANSSSNIITLGE